MVIWKYPLDRMEDQDLLMPVGAEILCVQEQDDKVVMWVKVDPDAKKRFRHVKIVGTGEPFERIGIFQNNYIGTIQQGMNVWHVFELLI